jgi:hypothetical protein
MSTDKPDAVEPVEPTGEELLQSALDSVETDFDEDCLRIFREGRAFERAARERKRGEKPANPSRARSLGVFISHEPAATDWQQGFDAALQWADSGDSDELAALRAELELSRAACNGANSEREFLQMKLRDAENERDELSDHLDRVKLEHDETRGYRQHAESLLVDMTAERDAEKARADRAFEEGRCEGAKESHAQWIEMATQLTQAKARIAELEEAGSALADSGERAIDALTKEVDELKDDMLHVNDKARANTRLTQELAEARELDRRVEKHIEHLRGLAPENGSADYRVSAFELADELETLLLAHRAKTSAAQSPSSADSDARNVDPECINCGHVSSDHPRGDHCGACVGDEDGYSVRCDCSRFVEALGKPAPPPYETAPTLEKGVRYRVVEALTRGTLVDSSHHDMGRIFTATGEEPCHGDGWYCFATVSRFRVQRVESAPADKPCPTAGCTLKNAHPGPHRMYLDPALVGRAPSKLSATLDRIEANPPRGKVTEADGPLFIPAPADEPRMMGPLEGRVRRLEDAALDPDELPRVRREIRAERAGGRLEKP